MRNIIFALLIATLGGCASTASLDDAAIQVVDLTHPLDERTIFWPTSPSKFQLQRLAHGMTDAGFFYAANSFCMPEHGGTHLDAPIHFAEKGWTTDQIPVDRLVGPAAVIDVSARAESNPDYRLTREDVLEWERTHGRIPAGAIVLLRTGWSRRWPDRMSYMGDDTPGDASRLHFPSFGEDSARLLVEDRKVHALGVDTASIDYGPSSDFVVHRLASAANVPGLENLTGLEKLPPTGATVIALPIMIGGGSGGPARVIAVLPR